VGLCSRRVRPYRCPTLSKRCKAHGAGERARGRPARCHRRSCWWCLARYVSRQHHSLGNLGVLARQRQMLTRGFVCVCTCAGVGGGGGVDHGSACCGWPAKWLPARGECPTCRGSQRSCERDGLCHGRHRASGSCACGVPATAGSPADRARMCTRVDGIDCQSRLGTQAVKVVVQPATVLAACSAVLVSRTMGGRCAARRLTLLSPSW
jgi:hypothetical protein